MGGGIDTRFRKSKHQLENGGDLRPLSPVISKSHEL